MGRHCYGYHTMFFSQATRVKSSMYWYNTATVLYKRKNPLNISNSDSHLFLESLDVGFLEVDKKNWRRQIFLTLGAKELFFAFNVSKLAPKIGFDCHRHQT